MTNKATDDKKLQLYLIDFIYEHGSFSAFIPAKDLETVNKYIQALKETAVLLGRLDELGEYDSDSLVLPPEITIN